MRSGERTNRDWSTGTDSNHTRAHKQVILVVLDLPWDMSPKASSAVRWWWGLSARLAQRSLSHSARANRCFAQVLESLRFHESQAPIRIVCGLPSMDCHVGRTNNRTHLAMYLTPVRLPCGACNSIKGGSAWQTCGRAAGAARKYRSKPHEVALTPKA